MAVKKMVFFLPLESEFNKFRPANTNTPKEFMESGYVRQID